jgi:hypothetical protein
MRRKEIREEMESERRRDSVSRWTPPEDYAVYFPLNPFHSYQARTLPTYPQEYFWYVSLLRGKGTLFTWT